MFFEINISKLKVTNLSLNYKKVITQGLPIYTFSIIYYVYFFKMSIAVDVDCVSLCQTEFVEVNCLEEFEAQEECNVDSLEVKSELDDSQSGMILPLFFLNYFREVTLSNTNFINYFHAQAVRLWNSLQSNVRMSCKA